MRIGLFTDTYFPQVSGVATSIRTLKTQLEKMGHTVFIFTTTDRDVDRYEDWQIVRIPSVPFFAFKDRRVAYRGFSKALEIAKQYKLDIIHTQTEFSLGLLGIAIARELGFLLCIPTILNMKTMSAILPKVWLSVQVWLSTLFVAL